MRDYLQELSDVIENRKANPAEGSYTCYLFEKGLDKILKKVAEECGETIIAAKNGDKVSLCAEVCDLMASECDLPLSDIYKELEARSKKIGNLKNMKSVDKLT
jgi:phosphoribosyl-ATP pyrophosphohydrolase